jgi:hypothetical protein
MALVVVGSMSPSQEAKLSGAKLPLGRFKRLGPLSVPKEMN